MEAGEELLLTVLSQGKSRQRDQDVKTTHFTRKGAQRLLRLKTRLVKAAVILIKRKLRTLHWDNEGDLRANSHPPKGQDCKNANPLENRALARSCLNRATYRGVWPGLVMTALRGQHCFGKWEATLSFELVSELGRGIGVV